MFGWLPSVDLNQIKDDMSNTACGYSFVEHPDNDLSTAYLSLSTRVCTAQGDGLLRGDRWDLKAVSEYLKMSEEYREYIAAMMLTLGSQAPGDDGLPAMVWKQVWPVVKERGCSSSRRR
jgi:hypothetical protein